MSKRIALAKTVAPRASADTLGGDWLRELRAAVAFNVAFDRLVADAEGKAAA